jgi:site-specific DNA-methyltransferase (adenine-specific)
LVLGKGWGFLKSVLMIKTILGNNIEELQKLELDYSKVIFVTDPPFNVGYHYNSYSDKMKEADYFKYLAELFKGSKHVIIHYPEDLHRYSIEIGKAPQKLVSWLYNSNLPKQHRDIAFYDCKPDFSKVGQPYKNPKDKRIRDRVAKGKLARLYDWWEIQQIKNVNAEKTQHPCQMPYEVMRRIVGILPKGYTIIDPFLGSGTTALACIEYKRDFIGIEMDKKYYDISNERIKSFQFKLELFN